MSGRVGMGEHPTTHGSVSGSGNIQNNNNNHHPNHPSVPAADRLMKNNEVPSIHTDSPPPPPPPPPPQPPHSQLPLRSSNAGLQIRTDLPPSPSPAQSQSHITQQRRNYQIYHPQVESTDSARSVSPLLTPAQGLRHTLSQSSLSPSSLLTSPALAAMIDITPLPSPIMLADSSPGPWKRMRSAGFDHPHPHSHYTPRPCSRLATSPPQSSILSASPDSPVKKKKGYGSLMPAAVEAQAATVQNMDHYVKRSHNRNRSVSDFVPEVLHNVRPRNVTVGPAGLHITTTPPAETPMQREQYLAQQRGLVQRSASDNDSTEPRHPHSHTTGAARASVDSAKVLPSPPPSSKSLTESELADFDDLSQTVGGAESSAEYFEVRSAHENKKRKWRAVKVLGQGTFSKVILATSQRLPRGQQYEEPNLDPRKLVAVKVVEHGPAGGADEERIEVSLKREVDILKSVSHPSIVQLKALEYTDERALLVLSYCPGGDLFELASERRDILNPRMVQRMFAELVGAVRHLHTNYIVHRDIKLENVLVTPTYAFLSTLTNPQSHRYPLICLTDLGLSRRIPQPPASPLLTTRCGSEDYAAPEILLGQPYDGRSTDGWALGVLLYALMEGRLPFDCPPGKPERSKPSHRIARADWIWCRFGDEDGEWDPSKKEAKEWDAARVVVEGLLKKVRMGRKGLAEVEDMEFVKTGVLVPGGLRRFDDSEPL